MYIFWIDTKDQVLKVVIHKSLLLSLLKEFGTLEKWFDSIEEYHFGDVWSEEIRDDYCTRVKYRDC
jgi:hypothetical protein